MTARSVLRRDGNGFSLIEVLVAVAVLALVSVGIIGGISGLLAHTLKYRDRTQLYLLARSKASEIEMSGVPEKREGSFGSHPGFRWSIRSEPLREGAGLAREDELLKEVTLTVESPAKRAQSFRMLAR